MLCGSLWSEIYPVRQRSDRGKQTKLYKETINEQYKSKKER